MDKQRAIQIMASDDNIKVLYKSKSVWIEGVKEDKANITVMGTCTTMDVPVADLQET